jgi:hypothetical protein
MDVFSHGLYGGVAFGRGSRRDYITAFLFGIAPDILAFGVFFLVGLAGSRQIGRPSIETIPSYVFSIYNFSHSLVIFGIFFTLLWLGGKKHLAKLSLAWPLHILVDMPTHDAAFFPTPFLWPISDFHIDGISWARPIIFIPNLIIIFGLYMYWYLNKKRIHSPKS